tara:strand:+ start:784 stop:888 length:105 start_codon:yes stop_codon:yes gene_type:complete
MVVKQGLKILKNKNQHYLKNSLGISKKDVIFANQ